MFIPLFTERRRDNMRVTLCAPDELIRAFREICKAKYGKKRGAFARGFVEAISEWVMREAPRWMPPEFEFDPDNNNEIDYDGGDLFKDDKD
jgi:hypothetical protein